MIAFASAFLRRLFVSLLFLKLREEIFKLAKKDLIRSKIRLKCSVQTNYVSECE